MAGRPGEVLEHPDPLSSEAEEGFPAVDSGPAGISAIGAPLRRVIRRDGPEVAWELLKHSFRDALEASLRAWLVARIDSLMECGGPDEEPELADAILRELGERPDALAKVALDEKEVLGISAMAARLLLRGFDLDRVRPLFPRSGDPSSIPSPLVRLGAVYGLGDRGDAEGLREFAKDAHPDVADRASFLLEGVGGAAS